MAQAFTVKSMLLERDDINEFIMPPSNAGQTSKDYSQNPVFTRGSNLTLIWSSNYTTIILDFTQDLAGCVSGVTPCGLTSTLYEAPSNPSRYDWTVEPAPYNISASNVFYFVMYNRSVSDTSATFTSHYFNITEAGSPSGTSTSASSFSSGPTTSAAPSNNTSAPTAKLSQGAEIGIVVAVLALAISGLIGGFLFFRRRKRMHSSENPTNCNWTPELDGTGARGFVPRDYRERIQSFPEIIHEVPGSQAAELDGGYEKLI